MAEVLVSKAPVISVVLPVYNGANYLAESIESILGQTFTDFELILIDDASTDHSLEVAASYRDRRLIIIRNEENLGLIGTLNKGLGMARGEFIARMDQDDIAFPERFSRQVNFLRRHHDVGLCGSHVIAFDHEGERYWRYPERDDDIRCRLLFSATFAHPSVMYRRTLITQNDICYDERFPHAEDYAFWIQCMPHCKMANIGEPLLRYRLHESNTASVFGPQRRVSVDRIYRELLSRLHIDPNDDELLLHSGLAYRISGGDLNLLDRIDEWLRRLSDSNRVLKVFPMVAFERCLEYYWLNACRSLLSSGVPTSGRYRESCFGRPLQGHLSDWLKLAIHSFRLRLHG